MYHLNITSVPSLLWLWNSSTFQGLSMTFLRQPCTFWMIFHIQYTTSLHAVIFTLQRNHYLYINRVAEYSIQFLNKWSFQSNVVTRIHSNMAQSSIRLSIDRNCPNATNRFLKEFPRTFKEYLHFWGLFYALKLQLLNSSTFWDVQGPGGYPASLSSITLLLKNTIVTIMTCKMFKWPSGSKCRHSQTDIGRV